MGQRVNYAVKGTRYEVIPIAKTAIFRTQINADQFPVSA